MVGPNGTVVARRFTVDVEWAPQAARVVVGDQGSPTAPAVTAKAADATWAAEHGRGLWLVDDLADDWGTASHLGHRWTWAGIQWQAKGGPVPGDPAGCETAWTDVTGMREAFPGATIWWGHQTRAWWAALPGASDAGGLVDAATRGDLRRKLAATCPNAGRSRDDAR